MNLFMRIVAFLNILMGMAFAVLADDFAKGTYYVAIACALLLLVLDSEKCKCASK